MPPCGDGCPPAAMRASTLSPCPALPACPDKALSSFQSTGRAAQGFLLYTSTIVNDCSRTLFLRACVSGTSTFECAAAPRIRSRQQCTCFLRCRQHASSALRMPRNGAEVLTSASLDRHQGPGDQALACSRMHACLPLQCVQLDGPCMHWERDFPAPLLLQRTARSFSRCSFIPARSRCGRHV